MHEVNILDQLLPESGAFYIMDRGFLDLERLYFHSRQGMGGSACRCHMASQQAPSAGNYALPNTALVGSPPTKPVSAGRAWRV